MTKTSFFEFDWEECLFADAICDHMKVMKITHLSLRGCGFDSIESITIVAACEGTNIKLLDISCHGISEEDCSHVKPAGLHLICKN